MKKGATLPDNKQSQPINPATSYYNLKPIPIQPSLIKLPMICYINLIFRLM